MNEKVIKVFFDQSGLPYKDRELTTHFPIVGSGFLGASNTTKIRFYFENIGLLSDTYLAVSKLPNGKQGSQLLNIKSSDENGQYAELSLSEWYFQAKGDVFIGLKVYRGGVEVEIDEETGFSIVSGDPVIMVTGSIKLSVNYAPIGDVPDYRDEFTAYNDILELIRGKLDINKSIYATSDIYLLDMSLFEENQIFFDYTRKVFYKNVDGTAEIILDTYDKETIDTLLSGKQDTLISGQNIKTINGQSILGNGDLPVSGGGADYTAGYGIDIADDTISVDTDEIATRDFVNSSIATNTATFRGTYNVVSDLSLTTSATHQEIASAIATKLASLSIVADDNDYVFVSFPNATVSTDFDKYERYKFNGISWEYEYTLNNSSFTADQWAAINSGITSGILSGLATKVEVDNVNENIAPAYDENTSYSVGEVVINPSGKLVKANTTISTPETYDSTHWDIVSVASDFVNLTGTQTITGTKDFTNGLKLNNWKIEGDQYDQLVLYLLNARQIVLGTSYLSPNSNLLNISLGKVDTPFNNLHLKGTINPNASGYGLSLPSTASLTANKEIATTDQAFNVINASDIVNNTLTQAQYDLITNGKPTIIVGTIINYLNPILLPCGNENYNVKRGLFAGNSGYSTDLRTYQINTSTKVLSFQPPLRFGSDGLISNFNNKTIPSYPSDTGTFVLKCVDGVLTWVAE